MADTYSFICLHIYLNIQTVPRVTPARVNGGGGGRSELVITWEVNMHLYTLHDFVCVCCLSEWF